jgi:predicted RND superfamily exporter protein
MASRSRLEPIFQRVVALRWPILALYALLVPLAAIEATRIPSDAAIGSLVMPSDPDYAATRAFQRIFPEGQIVLLLLEVDDPWSPAALAAVDATAAAVRAVPGATVYSALDAWRRARPGFTTIPEPRPEAIAPFRAFLGATDLFRRQGLAGEHHWGLAVAFPSAGPAARDATLDRLDAALAAVPPGPVRLVRKVGAPLVEAWIERESGRSTLHWFPVFGLFVVGLALFLYRSVRTLLAILLSLGAAVALAVGLGHALGYAFTVVSALVPLTVMVTALASLVYLHSRFVDQPEGVEVDAHQRFALANKFLPVTASTVAAVLGFAALAVSAIRPIREMGIWTACGLAVAWVVSFTLFPALQKVLRTPTGRVVAVRSALYDRLAAALPGFTYRWRWPFLVASLLLSAGGLVALAGWPGAIAPMRLGVDGLDYVDPADPVHRDMVWFREHVSGLNVARAWIRTGPGGAVTDPEVLRALDRFQAAVEGLPGVSAVVGPTTFLRVRRALAGQPAACPRTRPPSPPPPATWRRCSSPSRSCAASSTSARWSTPR